MSARASITNALVDVLKDIDGTGVYQTNIFGNVENKLRFWDELNDFPHICVVPGSESREYLPSDFKWGFLNISLKLYTKSEEPLVELEKLLEDVENVVDSNRALIYDVETNSRTTEILISSIVTDEGLLAPYGVGEINLQVRYQVL
jgi:hypothetical protein